MFIKIYINNDKSGVKILEKIDNVDDETFDNFVEDLEYYIDERLGKINKDE